MNKPQTVPQKSGGRSWIFNRYFILVTLFNLAGAIILQMYNSTISLHIDALQKPAVLTGTITSVGAITALCYRVLGGALCDRYGRRRLLIFGFPLFGVASFLMSLVDLVPLIFALRIVQMIGYAATTTTVSVAVVDITPRAHMTEGIGYFGLAMSLASAAGPSIALALFDTSLAFRAVTLTACVISIVATICVVFFFGYEKDPAFAGDLSAGKPQEKKRLRVQDFIEVRALPAAAVNFFLTFATGFFLLYLTLYASRAGIGHAGLFFTLSAICMIISRLFAGKLADRFGTLSAVIPGCALIVLTFLLLLPSARAQWLFFAAGALEGFGVGMTNPALNAAAVKAAPPERKAIASSTFMLPFDVAFMFSAIIWGALIDQTGFTVVFLVAGAVALLALLISIPLFLRKHGKSDG